MADRVNNVIAQKKVSVCGKQPLTQVEQNPFNWIHCSNCCYCVLHVGDARVVYFSFPIAASNLK